MLRSNTRQARENIREYIVNHFDSSSYTDIAVEGWRNIAVYIMECFFEEKVFFDMRVKKGRISQYDLFVEWAAGLPSILDTCYYYNRSAVDDLAAILDESNMEKSKFSEHQAEEKLTYLIYRELLRESEKVPLLDRLLIYGYPANDVFHSGTDLYIYRTFETRSVVSHWCKDNGYNVNHFCDRFIDQVTGREMLDIAFQYTPEWEKHCKGV